MKGIKMITVGKIKEDYFRDGIAYFQKEIRKRYPVSVLECPDEPTPDKASPAEEDKIRKTEGKRIMQKITGDDYVIALCIDGIHYDTVRWQRHLDKLVPRISGSMTFVIGGSLGLSPEVIKRADERLSFSAMTFPHQMMRLILFEQIARWTAGQQ